ncbi:hypothetical protein [Natrinema halophilum]|uniref:Uncharacterized protein n=1 Tax=Natrinema halophilum TaxID=1699371 RepID=A0A7D5KC61_9EURY|nr:hypothetical protein [Natrinema halophilum]QLG48376.1 hypothetical protein HYG82_05700 [Natrinema halophilum]
MTEHLLRSIRSDRRAIAWGAIAGASVFLLFGLVTGLIPNPLYVRMVPRTPVDYLLLTLTALLAGLYAAQRVASESRLDGADGHSSSEHRLAMGGLIGGFLAVGCPICNVFLLALFSSSALMTYFDPFRPVLGVLSVAVLSGLIFLRHRRSCPTCDA